MISYQKKLSQRSVLRTYFANRQFRMDLKRKENIVTAS